MRSQAVMTARVSLRSILVSCLVAAALPALAAPAAAAPPRPPIRVTTVAGDGALFDSATALAVSPAGSLYSRGYVYRAATSDDLTIDCWDDAPDGWHHVYRGARADTAADIAVAGDGSLYVAATIQSAAGDTDVGVFKLSEMGRRRWVRVWAGIGGTWDFGTKIGLDAAGNVLVAGSRRSSPTGAGCLLLLKCRSDGKLP